MEDIDTPLANRLRNNMMPVTAATVLAGVSWYWANGSLLQADCPGLQRALLAICLGVGWLLCLRALVFGPDGPIEQVVAISLMLALGLGLPVFGGGFLADVPGLRNQFCKECANRQAIIDLLDADDPEGAYKLALGCGDTEKDLQVKALLQWSDNLIAADKIAANKCEQAEEKIDLALSVADDLPPTPANLELKIRAKEKKEALTGSQACGPTPTPTATNTPTLTPTPTSPPTPTATPTPAPVLEITLLGKRLGKRPGKGVIDFKLTADGTPVPDLSAAEVTASNSSLEKITLLERSEKDPVCVIAVVDNSESIKEKEVKILWKAIEELNTTQKKRPRLKLGMVVFDTVIVKTIEPSARPLDAKLITGKGQNTALWLGVDTGIKLASLCEEVPELDRYLFVVTDGDNNTGNKSKAEIMKAANDTGVGICTVGIYSDKLQAQPLKDVALGCAYRFAKDVETVRGLLQEILYDTGNSWRITADAYACPVTLSVRGTSLEVCP